MNRAGRIRLGLVAAAAVLVLAIGQVAGAQEERDLETIAGKAESAASEVTGGRGPNTAAPAQIPDEPTDTDDSPGHTTEAPQPPPHASGAVLDSKLAGNDFITIGQTNSQINEDDSAQGDVVVLALGGNEVIGFHSHSEGPTEDGVNILGPVCEGSEGQLCVGLLFAHTESHEDANSSRSVSQFSVLDACLGGTQTEIQEECDGVVGIQAGTSRSEINKDKRSGAMTSDQQTMAANTFVDLGPFAGVSLAAIAASQSHSEASSTTEEGTTTRSSCILTLLGECVLSDPLDISAPPGCPGDPGSLFCVFFNQGSSFVFVGGAGSRQEAVHIDLLRSDELPGGRLFELHLATAETLAIAQEPQVDPPPPPPSPDDGIPRREVPTLPVTGAHALPLLALALILGTGGSGLLALGRRFETGG